MFHTHRTLAKTRILQPMLFSSPTYTQTPIIHGSMNDKGVKSQRPMGPSAHPPIRFLSILFHVQSPIYPNSVGKIRNLPTPSPALYIIGIAAVTAPSTRPLPCLPSQLFLLLYLYIYNYMHTYLSAWCFKLLSKRPSPSHPPIKN